MLRRIVWTVLFSFGCCWVSGGLLGSDKKPATLRLMSAEKDQKLRALMPKVEDAELQKLLADKRLLLYTEEEMPRAYQDWSTSLQGVHSAYYNISANGSEPHGNGNIEFPWGAPGGTHRTRNVSTFRFLWLPQNATGKTLPITWYRKHLDGDSNTGYAWMFPVGAVVGEVLLMDRPEGGRVPFELRVRTRMSDGWDVNVYRPFPKSEDLEKRIVELRPTWEEDKSLRGLVSHLRRPLKLAVGRLSSRHPGRRVFSQKMGIDTLPAIDDEKFVTRLLTETPFRSALGETWRSGTNKYRTAAPTTLASYHIVPANYDAGFIDVDQGSCMRCHDSVNTNVQDFEAGRDWYGRVRGSDGIFSFHPFEPGSISYNGYGSHPSIRQELVDAGWLAPYEPKVHVASQYQKIRGLDR